MIVLLIIIILFGIPLLHGIIDGLKTPVDSKTQVNIDSIENEIILLEINLERRKEAAAILEKELETCKASKRATILTRLNTLDKQSYKDMERINKLKDSL